MIRADQLMQQIKILDEQLAQTKTPIIEQNCIRTKKILQAELDYLLNKKSNERPGDQLRQGN